MTATVLDPTSALVIIDLQRGIASHPAAAPVVARAADLANAFRERGLPVVLVNVTAAAPGRTERSRPAGERAADWAELLPELGDGIRITKRTWGAFHGTDLDVRLREAGVTQVVVAGISTSKGVESTARAAYEHGYHVTVVTDAVADADPDVHANSITRIFPALGETATSAEVKALLKANDK